MYNQRQTANSIGFYELPLMRVIRGYYLYFA